MNYGTIKKYDIANGEGVRVSLFVSGCGHHCTNCFNQEAWDFSFGTPFTQDTEADILKALSPEYIDGLSLLGGEPFERENQRSLLPFLKRVRQTYPEKNIWCYTGFNLETELLKESRARCECTDEMLSMMDVLVDGRFEEKLKDISLPFRGSSNQRIIDVKATLAQGKVKLWELRSRKI